MKILKSFIISILITFLISCSKTEKISVVKEKNMETQMIEAFEEGYGAALCDIEAKIKEYFSG